jgi:ankyrin repeat protein
MVTISFGRKVVFGAMMLAMLLLGCNVLSAQSSPKSSTASMKETEYLLALAIRYARFDDLKTVMEEKKYPVNRRFPSGFTPLHAMVWSAANKPKEDTAKCRMMMEYLIKKGASVKTKAPPFKKWTKILDPHDSDGIRAEAEDSLNALQLAMLCGNIDVVRVMLAHDPNTGVADKSGNTLLHLAALYDYNARFDDRFVVQASDLLMLDRNVVNKAGQNPLVYYVSKPQWVTTAKLVIDHMINAGSNPDMRDHTGKNFYDYGKTVNPWIDSWLQQSAEQARVNKILKKFMETPPIDFEKQTKENLDRYEAWKKSNGGCGSSELNGSYHLSFQYYLSSPYGPPAKGQKCSANEEPIEVVVTPDRISISTLTPYYGSFQVCESGYQLINGVEYEYYSFKTTASNTTYTGFGRKKGDNSNAIIFTQNGSIMLGTSAFQYK